MFGINWDIIFALMIFGVAGILYLTGIAYLQYWLFYRRDMSFPDYLDLFYNKKQ